MCLLFFHHHNTNKTSNSHASWRESGEQKKVHNWNVNSQLPPTVLTIMQALPVVRLEKHQSNTCEATKIHGSASKLDLWPLTFSCSDNALWVQWEISVLPARRVGFALRRLSGKHGRPQLRALQGWLLPAGGGTELLALPLQPYRWVQVSQNPYVWKMLDVQTREQRWEDQFKYP